MNKEDRKDLVERLLDISRGDHERGCNGRSYTCSCGYDEESWKAAEEAADEIERLTRELSEREAAWEELCKRTFAVQHNPNCPSPWLVRLPGKNGVIDMKPYRDAIGIVRHQTEDTLGFGKSLSDAARAALRAAKGNMA